MTKIEFMDALSELIVNNSDIEAEEDDLVMFDGVEDVLFNAPNESNEDDASVTVLFTDGTAFTINIE